MSYYKISFSLLLDFGEELEQKTADLRENRDRKFHTGKIKVCVLVSWQPECDPLNWNQNGYEMVNGQNLRKVSGASN